MATHKAIYLSQVKISLHLTQTGASLCVQIIITVGSSFPNFRGAQ